jgi:hypothetical protein
MQFLTEGVRAYVYIIVIIAIVVAIAASLWPTLGEEPEETNKKEDK